MTMARSHHSSKSLHGQRGTTAIWFALLLPVLLGFAALAVDLARLNMVKTELQNAADASALAGAQALSTAGGTPYNWAAAGDTARAIATKNYANGSKIVYAQIETGYWNVPSATFTPGTTSTATGDVAAVRATVPINSAHNNGPLQLFFAGILGINDSNMQASSIATLPAPGAGTGVFPFAIGSCMIQDFWDFDHNRPITSGGSMEFNAQSIYHAGCMSGTWTPIGHKDDKKHNSADLIKDIFKSDGSTVSVNVGDETWLQSGDEESLYKDAKKFIGKTVPVLVVDHVVPNSEQTIVAIAALSITDIRKVGGHYHIFGQLSQDTYFNSLNPGTGNGQFIGASASPVLVK